VDLRVDINVLEEDKKTVPLYAMVALGGEEVYLLLILDLGTR
jgi:hypothetical protein